MPKYFWCRELLFRKFWKFESKYRSITMKKVLVAAALSVGFTAVSYANDNAPVALADAELDQIVAAGGPGHQRAAADLQGEVAGLMPGHVLGLEEGETPGAAHQSGASALKGGVADLVPDHVRGNP
jgi:hypothetical protein